MTERYVWLALPAYGSTVHCATSKSILHDVLPMVMSGIKVRVFDQCGHADIYSLRAQIMAHFLADEDKPTDLVMVDTDVAWDAGGLHKLLDHPVDCVAAAYPKRDYPLTFMFQADDERNDDNQRTLMGDPETGLIEVHGMPAGFMRCTREMLTRMRDAYRHKLESYDRTVPGEKVWRVFDPYWFKDSEGRNRVLSEDYAFCRRWRDIGGKVYMDASIPMAHIGTHAFAGCLGEFKQEKAA